MQFDCVISESKLVCMWGLEKTNDPQRDETSPKRSAYIAVAPAITDGH
jgi:hypothetical protein